MLRASILSLPLLLGAVPAFVQAQASDELNVRRAPGGDAIVLADGTLVHNASDSVTNLRRVAAGDAEVFVALWTEGSGNSAREMYSIRTSAGGTFSRARQTVPTIALKRGTFDPLQDAQPAPIDGLANSGQMYIVQFATQGIDAYRRAVAATGAEIHHYMPNQAHIVRMDEATAAQVEQLPMVR